MFTSVLRRIQLEHIVEDGAKPKSETNFILNFCMTVNRLID
jgi:hypothetical protein